jgi:hypothetical protein
MMSWWPRCGEMRSCGNNQTELTGSAEPENSAVRVGMVRRTDYRLRLTSSLEDRTCPTTPQPTRSDSIGTGQR